MTGRLAGLAAAAATLVVSVATAHAAGGFAVGSQVMRLVDHSRTIALAHGRREARPVTTYVRYPAVAPGGSGAAPATGPFPLLVFAEGFDVTPATYGRLLDAWARAGYVVAAPLFPLTNPNAPGGPDESDIVNQPRDISFAITSVIARLGGLVDPRRIAVAGHSDGAVTALAAAYGRRTRDPRIGAAMIFAGAQIAPFASFAAHGPPLLVAQGTADTTNDPLNSYGIFHGAPRPKLLLRLIGAGHLPPFTYAQPWLRIVERVSVAFLNRYLLGSRQSLAAIARLGTVDGASALTYQRR